MSKTTIFRFISAGRYGFLTILAGAWVAIGNVNDALSIGRTMEILGTFFQKPWSPLVIILLGFILLGYVGWRMTRPENLGRDLPISLKTHGWRKEVAEHGDIYIHEATLNVDTLYALAKITLVGHATSISTVYLAPHGQELSGFVYSNRGEGWRAQSLDSVCGVYDVKVRTSRPDDVRVEILGTSDKLLVGDIFRVK